MSDANAAFLFLGFLTAVGAAVLGLLALRKGKRSYGATSGFRGGEGAI